MNLLAASVQLTREAASWSRAASELPVASRITSCVQNAGLCLQNAAPVCGSPCAESTGTYPSSRRPEGATTLHTKLHSHSLVMMARQSSLQCSQTHGRNAISREASARMHRRHPSPPILQHMQTNSISYAKKHEACSCRSWALACWNSLTIRAPVHRHSFSTTCSPGAAGTGPSEEKGGNGSVGTGSSMQPEGSGSTQPQQFARIQPRLAMVFTCAKCETRAVKTFSRGAYERGLVLVRCPGCDKQHLVADHLGWFGDRGFTVEQLQVDKGTRVTRVEAGYTMSAALNPEDLIGWSKVQQLLQQVAPSRGPGSNTNLESSAGPAAAAGDAGEAGASGRSAAAEAASAEAAGEAGVERQQLEVEGVVELSPDEVQQWRKVQDAQGVAGTRSH